MRTDTKTGTHALVGGSKGKPTTPTFMSFSKRDSYQQHSGVAGTVTPAVAGDRAVAIHRQKGQLSQ